MDPTLKDRRVRRIVKSGNLGEVVGGLPPNLLRNIWAREFNSLVVALQAAIRRMLAIFHLPDRGIENDRFLRVQNALDEYDKRHSWRLQFGPGVPFDDTREFVRLRGGGYTFLGAGYRTL